MSQLLNWIQFITTQYKCMSHLVNTFKNNTQPLPSSSCEIIEHYKSRDEFFINSGLLFIGIMNHYFPKHVKNPDLASVNLESERQVVWNLAHKELEMKCIYLLEDYKQDALNNRLDCKKLGKHLEEYFNFFNGSSKTNSSSQDNVHKITSPSSLVTAIGMKVLTPKMETKSTELVVMEPIKPITTTTSPTTTHKPLPALPIHSTTNTQIPNNSSFTNNPHIENNISKAVNQQDEEEEKKELIYSKGMVFIDKEDSEEYYNTFKF